MTDKPILPSITLPPTNTIWPSSNNNSSSNNIRLMWPLPKPGAALRSLYGNSPALRREWTKRNGKCNNSSNLHKRIKCNNSRCIR